MAKKEYKTDEILAVVDPVDVVNYLGLETKRCGQKVSILCPKHDDKHFGSCKLTAKGYKCYSCGAHGDVFDLVQTVLNVSAKKSFAIVGDICGGREHFRYSKKESSSLYEKEKSYTKLPDAKTLDFIGIAVNTPGEYRNTSVYVCKEVIGEFDEYERKAGEKVYFETARNPDDNCKVIMQCVDRNPLQTLANEEPEVFKELIRNKALETMKKYAEMKSFVETGDNSNLIAHYCNSIAKECSAEIFIKVCDEGIRKAKSIAISYGWIAKRENKNIFGKIKLGAVL